MALKGDLCPINEIECSDYSKGLFWSSMLKPPSPGLCHVQELALEGLKFTWSAIGSKSTKHITEKQICPEVGEIEFILGWGRK